MEALELWSRLGISGRAGQEPHGRIKYYSGIQRVKSWRSLNP